MPHLPKPAAGRLMPRRRASAGPRLGRVTPEPPAPLTPQQRTRLARRAELREARAAGRAPASPQAAVRRPHRALVPRPDENTLPRAVEPDLDPRPPAGRPGPLPGRYLRAPGPSIRPDIRARFRAVVARALAKPLPAWPE